ncbi:class I SAM-dependent methyltransferase [Senegalia massiliensis]|uniref:class I SAM-dependent methyltransferase n=1 Tax=Senegalia massiliensis TaxID=1720316 RepID=UPI0010324FE6|nr:methyltransferase domain-containing protein [Senegalia massiliensis]
MEYMGDKRFWDEKFANRNDNPLSPEKSLVDCVRYFKEGTILDIACGDGRNSLFLLKEGFKVTGVDFSIKALERLQMFAKRSNYVVNTVRIDLSKLNSLNDIGVFDNILINHYRLSKEGLADIENHISDNGILFVCGFGHKHQVDSKIRKQDLIQSSDFEDVKKSFELVKYIEDKDERGFFVTYIFRKRSS